MSNHSLLFDFSCASGCYYAPKGNHYGLGRVTYGFAQQLAKYFPDQLGISSGDFSAECYPFMQREFPELIEFCIEPTTLRVESAMMGLVDLGSPNGEMRTNLAARIRRALWRPYDNKLRWQRSSITRRIYADAKLLHSEFMHSVGNRCPQARMVYTIHDLIGVTGEGVCNKVRLQRTAEYKSAWGAGAHFVCDSKYTADCLIELIGSGSERIGWSGLGLDPVFKPTENPALLGKWKTKFGIGHSQPYVVAHTGQLLRKNLMGVITVVEALRRTVNPDLILLFLGYPKELRTDFDNHLPASIRWRDFVRFSGNLADEDFPIIYSGAELMLFLSWAEGFGLPALEAMGCGVPLICSNRTSLPEVVGSGGVLVDPADMDAVIAVTSEVVQNRMLCDSLRSKALAQAKSHSWQSAGERLKNIWEAALNSA